MRSGASRAIASATVASTMPAPAAMVSRACASAVSPSATAAATPPCAHAVDAPSPIGAAVTIVTGLGLSLSAQNRPASPPPMMTMSSIAPQDWGGSIVDSRGELDMRFALLFLVHGGRRPACGLHTFSPPGGEKTRPTKPASSALQMDHPFHRAPRLLGDHRIDGDFLFHVQQAVEDLRQRDALHVRAEIAWLDEFDAGQLGLDVVGHRA